MEQNPRTPAGTDGLRPIGLPRPLTVRSVDGALRVTLRGREYSVLAVADSWRIAEEWWREEPLRRTYYRFQLDGGRMLTAFRDGLNGDWYEQHA